MAVRLDECPPVSIAVNFFELTIGANGVVGGSISDRYSPCYKFRVPLEVSECVDRLRSQPFYPKRVIFASGHAIQANYGRREHHRELLVLKFVTEVVRQLGYIEEVILISSRLVEFSVKKTHTLTGQYELHENYRNKKLALEQTFISHFGKSNPEIRRRIIRIPGVFGSYNDHPSRLIPSICLAGKTGKPLSLRSGILSKINLVPIDGLFELLDMKEKKLEQDEHREPLVVTFQCASDFTILSVIRDFFIATGVRIRIQSQLEHTYFERVMNDSARLMYPLSLVRQRLRLFFEIASGLQIRSDPINKRL